MSFTIHDHTHRFAAWAAARAASASSKCRFDVERGRDLLEACGFCPAFATVSDLPLPANFDRAHRGWREIIVTTSEKLRLSHGVAAKLINVYLKTRFVCAGHHFDEQVKRLHPPIDRSLLAKLHTINLGGRGNDWKRYRDIGWTNFTPEVYEDVIQLIRETLPTGAPLWMIEEYWSGYQETSEKRKKRN